MTTKKKAPSSVIDSAFSSPLSPIIFCAGGTGGHLFPAIATAKVLQKSHPHISVMLFSDKKGKESGLTWCTFFLPRKDNMRTLPFFFMMLGVQFIIHIVKFFIKRPRLVVGFGGYATLPIMLAARILRIQTILHEQNAVLGRVNRFLARGARVLCLSFKKTMSVPKNVRTVLTGNPVRFEKIPPPAQKKASNKVHIFIFGGSQGATFFADLIPQTLHMFKKDILARISITHQCRAEDKTRVQKMYTALGIAADIQSFFKDMVTEYTKADIVIARSGASTVAELTVAGRPAILVPYPFATDDHQFFNAQALNNKSLSGQMRNDPIFGESVYLFRQSNLSPKTLAPILKNLLEDEVLRHTLGANIKHFDMSHAANSLAHVVTHEGELELS